MFKVFKIFKKLNYIDDVQMVKDSHLTDLRDLKLIVYNKPILKTKACMTKAAEAKKNKLKKRIRLIKKPKERAKL